MVKEGIYYGLGLGSAAILISFLFHPVWAAPLFLAAAFCMYFFRDPERRIPTGDLVVSPADGKVVHIRPAPDGGSRISIFLNVFDVHINRSPIAGVIRSVEYQAGSFAMAHKESASESNEQNTLVIDPADSRSGPVTVKQIAGLIARRIVCYKKTDDRLEMGERFGLIKFGSRTDLHLGPEWRVEVGIGDRVAGGSSVIARPASPEDPRRRQDS